MQIKRTLTFFVSRLEYSRFVVASIVPDQSVETCVRTLAAHHAVMGGVPLLAAFDRPRPIGVRADDDGQVTEWDQGFAYAALEMGVGVEVRARRGAERRTIDTRAGWGLAVGGNVKSVEPFLEAAQITHPGNDFLTGITTFLKAHAAQRVPVEHLWNKLIRYRCSDERHAGADRQPTPDTLIRRDRNLGNVGAKRSGARSR